MAKRYYWLKLKKDFFKSVRMKKLRKIAGGDTFTIIYLKLLLETMDTDGMYKFQHTCESIEEEIAFELDEEVDNVSVTLKFLESVGLLQEVPDEDSIFFTEVSECVGSETDAASRMRRLRGQDNPKLTDKSSQSRNSCVTETNSDVTSANNVTLENRDKSKSRDIEIEKDIINNNASSIEEKENKSSNVCVVGGEGGLATASHTHKSFVKPSVDEIRSYCTEKGYTVDPENFYDFYESKGWMVGKNKMKDWKSAVRLWQSREKKPSSETGESLMEKWAKGEQ